MSRSTKTIIIIAIILLIACAIGCAVYYFTQITPISDIPEAPVTPTDTEVTQSPEPPKGKSVVGPISLPNYYTHVSFPVAYYSRESNEIETYYGTVATSLYGTSIPLKNKDVAASIEQDVNSKMLDIIHDPKKYGIVIPDDTSEFSTSVTSDCFNNIISYDIVFSYDFEESPSMQYAFGANYDLNTGDEIALRDVFTDNCDYMALIGKYYATESLNGNEPYTKINPNKMFSISPTGIILGRPSARYFSDNYYSMDFQDTDYGLIPYDTFKDNIAIFDRFMMSDESLFEDDVNQYCFLLDNTIKHTYVGTNDSTEDHGIYRNEIRVSASSGLPAATITAVNDAFATKYETFVDLYASAKAGHDEHGRYGEDEFSVPDIGYYHSISKIFHCSNYIFATLYEDYSIIDWQGEEFATYDNSTQTIINANTGEIVPLAALFNNGSSYIDAIEKKLAQDSRRDLYPPINDSTLTKVILSDTGMTFSFEYLENGEERSYNDSLSYSEIGLENIILFDKLR